MSLKTKVILAIIAICVIIGIVIWLTKKLFWLALIVGAVYLGYKYLFKK